MIDDALIAKAADALDDAERSRTPIEPISGLLGTTTDIEVAYRVQQHNARRWESAGRRVSGRKIGLTSKKVQAQIGVDQPDFGTLYSDTEYGDGVDIESGRLLQPRAEAEVALVLERDLDSAPHGFVEVMQAVAYALPAIEVVDSRIAEWKITLVDTVADNASCGLYVVGSRPTPLSAFDIATVPMSMFIDGSEVSTGSGSECMGNPLQAARWLADTLCERGIPLKAGDVLMTGALGPMVPFGSGNTVSADFGPLGTVTTHLN